MQSVFKPRHRHNNRSMGDPNLTADTPSSREQILAHLTIPKSSSSQRPAADHAVTLLSPRNTWTHGLMEPPPRSSSAQELPPGRQPALYICSSVQDPLAPGLCVTESSHPLSRPPSLPRCLPAVNTAGCPGHSHYYCFMIH